jgi:hypothetical protein
MLFMQGIMGPLRRLLERIPRGVRYRSKTLPSVFNYSQHQLIRGALGVTVFE